MVGERGLLSLLSHLLSQDCVTKVSPIITPERVKNAAFFVAGTFVTFVTDLGESDEACHSSYGYILHCKSRAL